MWNSNLVSTLSESNSSGSPSNNASMDVISANPEQNVGNKKARTSTSGGGGGGGPAATSKRSSNNKSKSKLSRVRYFLHPGEPAVGQIVSDSLTDGQDNNNTLSLKQPQVNVYYYLPICRYLVLLLLLIQGMTLQIVSIWVFWYLGISPW